MFLLRSALLGSLVILCSSPLALNALKDDVFFDIQEIENEGRSVAAGFGDFNGDEKTDLFIVALKGVGPSETREIRVYLSSQPEQIPLQPTHVFEVPHWSAVYDISDVRPETAGAELVLLRPDGVSIFSLAGPKVKTWDLRAPGPSSVGVADDERGLERFPIVYRDFGTEPWLLIPQIGQLTALSTTGELKAQIILPRRANYFILPNTGLFSLESDFQVYLDVPKLSVGDVDGDGRSDIISATRHEIRVFLQKKTGGFDTTASRSYPLRFVTARDHIRGSGGVTSEFGDINNDDQLDLLISHVQGSFKDATTTLYVYLNKGGVWDLEKPDETLSYDASLVSNALLDLDSDNRPELLSVKFDFSMLEFVELLLSSEIDATVSIRRYSEDGGFGEKPWIDKKLSLPFSFATFRMKGFIPTANADINGDTHLDFVLSGGGEELEFYLGGPKGPFDTKPLRQEIGTAGVIQWGDLNRDGLPDFVIFDPHNFDVPVKLGRNTGRLPGTRPVLRELPTSGIH